MKLLNINLGEVDTKDSVIYFANSVAQFHNTVVDIKDIPGHETIHLGNLIYADSMEDAIEKGKRFYDLLGR